MPDIQQEIENVRLIAGLSFVIIGLLGIMFASWVIRVIDRLERSIEFMEKNFGLGEEEDDE